MKNQILSFSTKTVVTISIGATLYGVTSLAGLPIGPNTQLRPSIIILTFFAVYFGPMVGFFSGFLGHILTDLLAGWGVWWNWELASGIFGFAVGLIFLFPNFSLKYGLFKKSHIPIIAVLGLVGFLIGYGLSGITDIFLMGEPPKKILFQVVITFLTNSIVFIFFSIPVIISFLVSNRKNSNLEIEK